MTKKEITKKIYAIQDLSSEIYALSDDYNCDEISLKNYIVEALKLVKKTVNKLADLERNN